jgi:hypothetical protein
MDGSRVAIGIDLGPQAVMHLMRSLQVTSRAAARELVAF